MTRVAWGMGRVVFAMFCVPVHAGVSQVEGSDQLVEASPEHVQERQLPALFYGREEGGEQASAGSGLPDFGVVELFELTVAPVYDSLLYGNNDLGAEETQDTLIRGFHASLGSVAVDGMPVLMMDPYNRSVDLSYFPRVLLKESRISQRSIVRSSEDGHSLGGHTAIRTASAFDRDVDHFFKSNIQLGRYVQGVEGDGWVPAHRLDAIGSKRFGAKNAFGLVFAAEVEQREYTRDSVRLPSTYETTLDISYGRLIDVPRSQTLYSASLYQTEKDRDNLYLKLDGRLEAIYGFISMNYFADEIQDIRYNTGYYLDSEDLISTHFIDEGRTYTYSDGLAQTYFTDQLTGRDAFTLGSGLDIHMAGRGLVSARVSYTRSNWERSYDRSMNFRSDQCRNTLHSYNITEDALGVESVACQYNDPTAFQHSIEGGRRTDNIRDILRDHIYSTRLDYEGDVLDLDSHRLTLNTGVWWRRLDRDFDRSYFHYGEDPLNPVFPDYNLQDNLPLTEVDALNPILIDRDAYWDFVLAHSNLSGEALMNTVENFSRDYALIEDVYAGYGEWTYSSDTFQVITGLRVEHTAYDIDNFQPYSDISSGTIRINPSHHQNSYTDFLPRLILNYLPQDNLSFTLSYSRSLARPDFSFFAPGGGEELDEDGDLDIVTSDPTLRAQTANNYDARTIYSFDNIRGFMSVDFFYKDIDHFTYQVDSDLEDNGLLAASVDLREIFGNGEANVFGFDGQLRLNRLDFLPAPFDRLGLSAKYLRAKGRTDMPSYGVALDSLPRQYEQLAQVRLDYRWNRSFGAGITYKHLGRRYTGVIENGYFMYNAPYDRVDAFMWYKLLSNFSLHFSVVGLNSPTWSRRADSSNGGDLLIWSIRNRPSFWFGLRYSI